MAAGLITVVEIVAWQVALFGKLAWHQWNSPIGLRWIAMAGFASSLVTALVVGLIVTSMVRS